MIKSYNYILLCLIFSLISVSVLANTEEKSQPLEQVKSQLKRIHWHSLIDHHDWAYTVETRLDNGNTGNNIQQTKQQFNPSLPPLQQWQLLESDFHQPTPARLALYRETQQQLLKDAKKNTGKAAGIADKDNTANDTLVEIASLQPLEINSRYHTYSFTPALPMFKQTINQSLKGVLTFDLAQQQVTQLVVQAQQKFSPRTGYTFTDYTLKLTVEAHEGQLHLVSTESQKKGKALFFTSFKEKSSRQFTQFISLNTVDKMAENES